MHSSRILALVAITVFAVAAGFAVADVWMKPAPSSSSTTPLSTSSTTTDTDPKPATTFTASKLGTTDSDLTYCTMDDTNLLMDIHWPQRGNGPFPAAIYVHGGGWSTGDKTQNLSQFSAPLTAKGVVVFAIDYRLANEFQFPAMIEDVKCAIRSIRANAESYNIDPDHIGIFGGSAGGHLVSLAGTADESAGWDDVGDYQGVSSNVQAVVDMYGPVKLTEEFEGNSARSIQNIFGVRDFANMAFASPITYVTPNDPPFLLIHGEEDTLVPIAQSEMFLESLQNAGVEAELIRVAHSGHSFRAVTQGTKTDPTIPEIAELMSDWLVDHLK